MIRNAYLLDQRLRDGCTALQVNLTAQQRQVMLEYLGLLEKWNKAFNLTAVREPEAMVSLHLLDSLTVVPFLAGKRCLDVGTGAGLPGIVLAVYDPARSWVLLDSNGKKTRFLTQVQMALGLTNIQIVQSRIENYRPSENFDFVISRAVGDVASLVRTTRPLWAPGAQLIAMKGVAPTTEIAECPIADVECEIRAVSVPELEAERHLIRVHGRDTSVSPRQT